MNFPSVDKGVFELKSININVLESENLMWEQRKAHQM